MTSRRRRVAVTLGLTVAAVVGAPLFVVGSAYAALWILHTISQIVN